MGHSLIYDIRQSIATATTSISSPHNMKHKQVTHKNKIRQIRLIKQSYMNFPQRPRGPGIPRGEFENLTVRPRGTKRNLTVRFLLVTMRFLVVSP